MYENPTVDMTSSKDILRVLIIEDNTDYVELARYMLHAASGKQIELESAGTLQQGLDKLSMHMPDLVLLDICLPDSAELDGLHAVKKVAPHIPVVILSSTEDENIAMTAIKIGADDFLVKGRISDWQLCRTINYAIERRNLYRKLERMAHFDDLTRLPNKNMFMFRLGNEISRAKRYNAKIGLLYMDLDHFKPVNDAHGHAVGDKLLVEVANRLNRITRKSDMVSRLSGDEFGLIIEEVASMAMVEKIARKVIDTIAKPYEIDDNSLSISVSIGITIYSGGDESIEELLEQADSAMYRAKNTGKNNLSFFQAGD